MRGLTILVVSADPVRYRAALELAAASAALGARTSLHLHGTSVALLAASDDLRAEAAALGVTISACQTGLAELPGCELPEGIEPAGLVGLLTALGEDRLLAF